MDIRRFINDSNRSKWEYLQPIFNISVHESDKEYSYLSTNGKEAKIHLHKNEQNIETFSHELLHVYLNSKKNNISGLFKNMIVLGRLNVYYSLNLSFEIGNYLDHYKMFPLFCEMGYEKSRFLPDFNTRKGNIDSFIKYQARLANKSYHLLKLADCYIGNYFAVKACPNEIFDYSNELRLLKRISPELFDLLDSFWVSWLSFDIDTGDYREIGSKFCNDLKDWTRDREVEYGLSS